jgi:hypothetical protein
MSDKANFSVELGSLSLASQQPPFLYWKKMSVEIPKLKTKTLLYYILHNFRNEARWKTQ